MPGPGTHRGRFSPRHQIKVVAKTHQHPRGHRSVVEDGDARLRPRGFLEQAGEHQVRHQLEGALVHFETDVRGKIALDVGASTGGFTDCLLHRGAAKVYAVDVGYGQLDWKLRNDSRVVNMEKLNARYMKQEDIPEPVDIIVIDVSFISLTKIIPSAIQFLNPEGTLTALIKPQFEVGKGEVGKGGIVRDENKHEEVVNKITKFIEELNFDVIGVIPSPILGARGNKEFLISAVKIVE